MAEGEGRIGYDECKKGARVGDPGTYKNK